MKDIVTFLEQSLAGWLAEACSGWLRLAGRRLAAGWPLAGRPGWLAGQLADWLESRDVFLSLVLANIKIFDDGHQKCKY